MGLCYTGRMELERKRNFITTVLYAVFIAAIVYVVFKYCIPLLFPFLFVLIVCACVLPAVNLLYRKLGVRKKLSAAILVTVLYLLLAGLLLLLAREVIDFVPRAGDWFSTRLAPSVNGLLQDLNNLFQDTDPSVLNWVYSLKDDLLARIGTKIAEFSADFATSMASWTPSFIFKVIITVVATYFITLDFDAIYRGITTRMTESFYQKFSAALSTLGRTIWKYIRAYSLIFLITFAELTLGLFCAGVKQFVLIAFLIAVFDILPILGSSMIMLPWSIITLIRGDYKQGIILFIVYLVVVIARQFFEPKIVGEHVGLHPIITLAAMFIGLKLFGGYGLFGLPILCAVIMQLETAGVISLFPKRREATETEPAKRVFRRKRKEKPENPEK